MTRGVHRLLEKYDMVPKFPVTMGTKFTFERP